MDSLPHVIPFNAHPIANGSVYTDGGKIVVAAAIVTADHDSYWTNTASTYCLMLTYREATGPCQSCKVSLKSEI